MGEHHEAVSLFNRDLNRLWQLDCLHAAVARRSGEIVFGLNGQIDDGQRKWGELRVPAWSIDDLSAKYRAPDVVFIDVEGFEHEALMGASQTLRAGPDWFVEVHHPQELARYGAASYRQIVECFDRRRYCLFAARDGLTLLDAISEHGFDAAFGGARRDEERARAKERILSFRDEFGQWEHDRPGHPEGVAGDRPRAPCSSMASGRHLWFPVASRERTVSSSA